jgi:hypothetical protein
VELRVKIYSHPVFDPRTMDLRSTYNNYQYSVLAPFAVVSTGKYCDPRKTSQRAPLETQAVSQTRPEIKRLWILRILRDLIQTYSYSLSVESSSE